MAVVGITISEYTCIQQVEIAMVKDEYENIYDIRIIQSDSIIYT